MSDVRVPFNEPGDQAVLLLAAAEAEGESPTVVRTETGAFVVDEALAKKAGVDYDKPPKEADGELPSTKIDTIEIPQVAPADQRVPERAEDVKGSEGLSGSDLDSSQDADDAEPDKPAKKAATKKATAKKAAAKSTAVNKES
jgi:hypothetical protein